MANKARKNKFSNTKPVKSLIQILKKNSGRDNTGTISVRHQGGRQKRYYRIIDFKRNKRDSVGEMIRLEYDPNRNAHIALIRYDDGEMRYILAPKNLNAGDKVLSADQVEITPGNATALKNIPIGIEVHNIEMTPHKGGTMIRAAGAYATVIARDAGYVQLKMPSGEVRKFLENCWATIGAVGNSELKYKEIGKAGRKIRMGIRPTVRGTAQNPRSHPHGGGEGRSGEGMHPKTPWGKLAKGGRTANRYRASRKLIVSKRK